MNKDTQALIDEIKKIEITLFGCGKDEGNPCVVSDTIFEEDAKKLAKLCIEKQIELLHEMKQYVFYGICQNTRLKS